jgi:hypothetical protein
MCKDLKNTIAESIAEHEAAQWRKFPENKPELAGRYQITNDIEDVEIDIWAGGSWQDWGDLVIAFCELPPAYQERSEGCQYCKYPNGTDIGNMYVCDNCGRMVP